jgi:hypothetical protein
MFFTKKDSATVYAAWCRKRYRAKAEAVVQSQIEQLEAKGDLKGVEIWRLVAEALSELESRGDISG